MAATKRGNITENMRAIIEALASVKKAEVASTRALHAVDGSVLPFVNITSSGSYEQGKSGLGDIRENWALTTNINIITLDDNAEDIRGDIKVALAADNTRGAHAINTVYKEDFNLIDLDIELPANAQGLKMIYEITYIVEEGAKI